MAFIDGSVLTVASPKVRTALGTDLAVAFTDFERGNRRDRPRRSGFAFDREGPRHRVLTEPFRLADRLVTNAECMEFIEDGGYTKPLLWLSEGWAKALAEGLSQPLYWETRDGQHWTTRR